LCMMGPFLTLRSASDALRRVMACLLLITFGC